MATPDATRIGLLDNLITSPSHQSVEKRIVDYAPLTSLGTFDKEFKLKEECKDLKGKRDLNIDHVIYHNLQLQSMFKNDPPKLLSGEDFTLITSGGKPVFIGQGTNGSVLLAQERFSLKLVAVKLIQHENSMTTLAGLLKEYAFQRKGSKIFMNGKRFVPKAIGILRLKSTSPMAQRYCSYMLVSEYCSLANGLPQSLSLHTAIKLHKEGRILFTDKQWEKLCLDILDAVNALNTNNIYHLDIKPNNIVLQFHGHEIWPILIDYGLSRTSTCTIRFSPVPDQETLYPHTAPELISATHQCFPLVTSDLYGVSYVIMQINTILKSFLLDIELRSYRAMLPAHRQVYLYFREIIRSHLSSLTSDIIVRTTEEVWV